MDNHKKEKDISIKDSILCPSQPPISIAIALHKEGIRKDFKSIHFEK